MEVDMQIYEKQREQEKIRNREETKKMNIKVNQKFEKPKSHLAQIMKMKTQKPPIENIKKEINNERAIEQRETEIIKRTMKMKDAKELHNLLYNVLTLPYSKNAEKRMILDERLQNSDVVKDYIDKTLITRSLSIMNDNIKFGLVYGLHLFGTEKDFNEGYRAKQKRTRKNTTDEEASDEESTTEEKQNIEENIIPDNNIEDADSTN